MPQHGEAMVAPYVARVSYGLAHSGLTLCYEEEATRVNTRHVQLRTGPNQCLQIACILLRAKSMSCSAVLAHGPHADHNDIGYQWSTLAVPCTKSHLRQLLTPVNSLVPEGQRSV